MSRLIRHLREGERVLWTGKPVVTPFIFKGLLVMPLGLLFLGLAILSIWGSASLGGRGFLSLFDLFYVFIGLGIVFGPLTAQVMRYRNTEYMITDQRIVTQTGAIGLDTRFVELDRIQEVYVNVGFVDKIFGTGSVAAVTAGFVFVGTPRLGGARPSLTALRDPYRVHQLLQEALQKRRA